MSRAGSASETAASDAGVVFPMIDGIRSSLATGQGIIAAATSRVDTAIHEAARDEPDWRNHYVAHFRELTRLSAQQHAMLIASDGLAAVHQQFRNRRHGAELPVMDALAVPRSNFLHSWSVSGSGPRSDGVLAVPYEGEDLHGSSLRQRVQTWVDEGIAEPSFGEAIESVVDNPAWLDLRDTTFVLLGAGAEMAPLRSLLEWGAHVVALDLPDPTVWRRLMETARSSPGTLTVPTRRPMPSNASDNQVALHAGADIITEAPEIAAWLASLPGPFFVGDYVYAPGSMHVRSSVAVDSIIAHVRGGRSDFGLAYLATPTDTYAVSSDIVDFSRRRLSDSGALVAAARGLTGGRVYRPNYPKLESTTNGLRFGVADALVPQQGPNYALAKRIQRWRALASRAQGTFVSINVAPATRTRSVTHNRLLSAAYDGAHRFGLEIFEPRTSSTLMAALLVHDVRNTSSLAHQDISMNEALDFFENQALHGGMWRAPFAPRSVLGMAVALGLVPRS